MTVTPQIAPADIVAPGDDLDAEPVAALFLAYNSHTHTEFVLTSQSAITAATVILQSRVAGDTQDRYQLLADGTQKWGPGNALADAVIQRGGPNSIRTVDTLLWAQRAATGAVGFQTNVVGDVQPRWNVKSDGSMAWGDGASNDLTFSRNGTNQGTFGSATINLGTLVASSSVTLSGAASFFGARLKNSGAFVFVSSVVGDAVDRFTLDSNGKHSWGPGGSTATDVTLSRTPTGGLVISPTLSAGDYNDALQMGARSFTISSSGSLADGIFAVWNRATDRWEAKSTSTIIGPNVIEYQFGGAIKFRSAPVQAYTAGDPLAFVDALTINPDGTVSMAAQSSGALKLTNTAAGITFGGDSVLKRRNSADLSVLNTLFTSEQSATNSSALSTYITGEAQRRFIVNAGGQITWSDGVNPADTMIYRRGAKEIGLNDSFITAQRTAATDLAFRSLITGDGAARFSVDASGKHSWGDGTNAADVTFSRTAAGRLQSSGDLYAINFVGSGFAQFTGQLSSAADIISRSGSSTAVRAGSLTGGSGIRFGDGVDATTEIWRQAASVIRTAARFDVQGSATNSIAYGALVSGDAALRFQTLADGRLRWGAGSGSPDIAFGRVGNGLIGPIQDAAGFTTILSVPNVGSVVSGAEIIGLGVGTGTGRVMYQTSYDASASSFIGHNVYRAPGGQPTWGVTHPSFGSRAIEFSFSGTDGYGIRFYADKSATTLGAAATMTERFRVQTDGTIAIGGGSTLSAANALSAGSGGGVVYIGNAAGAPATNPVGGGIAYVESGALKYRDTSGNITVLGGSTISSSAGFSLTGSGSFTALSQAAASTTTMQVRVAGDVLDRFNIAGDGKMNWGNGGATPDTNLYRVSAGILQTDSEFRTLGTLRGGNGNLVVPVGGRIDAGNLVRITMGAAGDALQIRNGAEASFRFTATNLGILKWGDGTTLDVQLSRQVAQRLQLGDGVTANMHQVVNPGTGDIAYAARANADTVNRIQIYTDGGIWFGPGNGALDTLIQRAGVGIFKAAQAFHVGGDFRHLGTNIGFFNTAQAVKQAVIGSRGGNAALASLLTALATYGLITDSTTA